MTTTRAMWTELHDLADRLTLANGITQPTKQADIKTIRSAALTLEGWFTANQEILAERDQAREDAHRYRTALQHIQATLQLAQRFAGLEACELDPDQFGRDLAPHINLMGGLGDPDYLNGELSCRHIDTRADKPRPARKAAGKAQQPTPQQKAAR